MRKIIKRKNRGFTIVELIVVMAIIAILILIAVPTFTKYIDDAKKTSELGTEDTIYKATITAVAEDYLAPESEKTKLTPGLYMFSRDGDLEAEIEEGVSGMTPKTADNKGVIVFGYNDQMLPQAIPLALGNDYKDSWRVFIKSSYAGDINNREADYIDVTGDIYILSPDDVWYKNGDPLE